MNKEMFSKSEIAYLESLSCVERATPYAVFFTNAFKAHFLAATDQGLSLASVCRSMGLPLSLLGKRRLELVLYRARKEREAGTLVAKALENVEISSKNSSEVFQKVAKDIVDKAYLEKLQTRIQNQQKRIAKLQDSVGVAYRKGLREGRVHAEEKLSAKLSQKQATIANLFQKQAQERLENQEKILKLKEDARKRLTQAELLGKERLADFKEKQGIQAEKKLQDQQIRLERKYMKAQKTLEKENRGLRTQLEHTQEEIDFLKKALRLARPLPQTRQAQR